MKMNTIICPLKFSEKIMVTGGPIDREEGVSDMSLENFDTLNGSLSFVRYIIFYTLDLLSLNSLIYYKYASSKWYLLGLYLFSAEHFYRPCFSETYLRVFLRI